MLQHRLPVLCGCLILMLPAVSTLPAAHAQKPKDSQKPKEPQWTHAFDLSCRKYGESEFSDKTAKFGVEVFKDANTGYGIYVSQAGSFAAVSGFVGVEAFKDSKPPQWLSGLDLPSRKAGEQEFTKKTRVYGVEVFRDANVNNWVYLTETGTIAVAGRAKSALSPPGSPERPKWLHSVDLSCRKGGMMKWKDAGKFGIEVYRDQNTGNLIYICDTGTVAVPPDVPTGAPQVEGKAPVWLHGLDLYCRKHSEREFSKKTQKFGVEVFRDENNGNLIYLCESGSLAVVPGGTDLKAPTPKVLEPKWTHGLNLSCRSVGEKEFTANTRVYGVEVFRDENTGAVLYLAETGSISAVPSK